MEEVRTFIAIKVPEEVKKKLGQLEEQLKSGKLNAKWVAPESIHLTIKFLGNITVDSISEITKVIEEAALYTAPFRLRLGGVGVFPNPKSMRVLWVGVNGNIDRLLELQKQVDEGLVKLGFAPESRPFTAHLTIARVRDEASQSEREALAKLAMATSFESAEFQVESINLIKSQLRQEGPIYTDLVSVPLVD